MDEVKLKVQVLFEEPFWIAIIERIVSGELSAVKITFGPEPKDYEVYEYLLIHYDKLRFSPTVKADVTKKEHVNPKRQQRIVRKELNHSSISTKSQAALSQAREQLKTVRKEHSKEEKEAFKQRQFELKQEKKRQKHRGH